jgi:hypothetical protein
MPRGSSQKPTSVIPAAAEASSHAPLDNVLYPPVGGPGSRARSPPLAVEATQHVRRHPEKAYKSPIFDSPGYTT